MSKITTSQTIGPFSHEAWNWATELSAADTLQTTAPTIIVSGTIYDGDGNAINDAQIESWQPAAAAAESGQAIPGFRRIPSDEEGKFSLRLSVSPQAPGEPLAYVTVFARGLVKHQFTAVFLEDDAGLKQSAILEQVSAARRPTLLATRTADGQYSWNIHMQGEQETVFFDYE
ncbi:peptidase associated/transthyretin-like domain-containing protein [Glaciimonas soli]|uniref:Protocatechuate 3,4-dioxygenase n=1 Tax=Glaciimonas soli TaxID=2590999 RepID=A0A843YMN5_9BURK|nr:protocatechuate 3,4-dioxygenase [Glaciimonas soli]MQR00725.1 protocatechuate 3,4-dioxygenase [Glaciimonas soli]